MDNKLNNLEEMSTMSAGSVSLGATKAPADDDKLEEMEDSEEELQKEAILRSMIQRSIELYAQKKKHLSDEVIFEEKLRKFIFQTILNEKQSTEAPPGSTLEGIMRTLLNKIIPQLRIQYMQLQSNEEERQGFKDYFNNAINSVTELSQDQKDSDNVQELEEEDKITLKSEDPDFISGVGDGTEPDSPKKKKTETGDEKKVASSYFERGQNFGEKAFNAIHGEVEDVVYSQIVPEEYEEFKKILNANIQSWMKIWDQNKTKSDQSQDLPVDQTPTEEPVDQELTDEEPVDQELAPEEINELLEKFDLEF